MNQPKAVKVSTLKTIVPHEGTQSLESLLTPEKYQDVTQYEYKSNSTTTPETTFAFVAPVIPHFCELLIWNKIAELNQNGCQVITSNQEKDNFDRFTAFCFVNKIKLNLEFVYHETVLENRSFLSGLEHTLTQFEVVVCYGESHLSTFQAIKNRLQNHPQTKIIVWQTFPRPPQAHLGQRAASGTLLPSAVREKTVRREILSNCDLLLSFDKDAATWAFLEKVDANRLRRFNRSICFQTFTPEKCELIRRELRKNLNLSPDDFIFLHLGPAELESGCLDSLYAFKAFIVSHPETSKFVKMMFFGKGMAEADLRQAVLELELDNHVLFIMPEEGETLGMPGNRLTHLLPVADTVIHGSLVPHNSYGGQNLDVTYDALAAVGYGIPVCSNGSGWIGDWSRRFFPCFSLGNPFSQARVMFDLMEKTERRTGMVSSARKSILNELDLEKFAQELFGLITTIKMKSTSVQEEVTQETFKQIEGLIKDQNFIGAIDSIETAFGSKYLSPAHKAVLFRYVGDCFTKLGDLESGLQNYLRSLELDHCCAKSFIGLGTIALQQKNPHAAVPQFHKAMALSPQDDMASLGLSLAYGALEDKANALLWAHRATILNAENEMALFQLSKLAYELNTFTEAEDAMKRALERQPQNNHIRYSLAGLLYHENRIEESTQHLNTIISIDPANQFALNLLMKISSESHQQKAG